MNDDEASPGDATGGEGVGREETDDGSDTASPTAGGVCRAGAGSLHLPDTSDSERDSGDAAAGPLEVEPEEDEPTPAELLEETGAAPQRVETRLRWEGPGKIVYEPRIVRTGPDRFAIEAKRERRGVVPWGFWGGLLFLGVAFAAIVGAENFYTLWDILWILIGLSVGAALYRFGQRTTLEEILLCYVDLGRRVLEWPEGAQSGLDETVASFDQITEVVFGMTTLPVDEGAPDVRVDAFALLVRTTDEELIPVVEGSPYKGGVHEIAKFLAEETETELTYVGEGIEASGD